MRPRGFSLDDPTGQALAPALSPALRLLHDAELSRAQRLLAACSTETGGLVQWMQKPGEQFLERLFAERPADTMVLPWPCYTSALFLEPAGNVVLAEVLTAQPQGRRAHIDEFLHRDDDESGIVVRPISGNSHGQVVEFRPRDFICHVSCYDDFGDRYNRMCQLASVSAVGDGRMSCHEDFSQCHIAMYQPISVRSHGDAGFLTADVRHKHTRRWSHRRRSGPGARGQVWAGPQGAFSAASQGPLYAQA